MAAAAQRQPPPSRLRRFRRRRPAACSGYSRQSRRAARPPAPGRPARRRDGARGHHPHGHAGRARPSDARPLQLFARLLLPDRRNKRAPARALSEIIDAAPRRKPELIVLHLHFPRPFRHSPITSHTARGHGIRSSSPGTSRSRLIDSRCCATSGRPRMMSPWPPREPAPT